MQTLVDEKTNIENSLEDFMRAMNSASSEPIALRFGVLSQMFVKPALKIDAVDYF